MFTSRFTSTFAVMLLCSAPLARAQSSVDVSGHWEGTIKAPGRDVAIEIDLGKSSTGEFVATFGNPAEHLAGFPLSNVVVNGSSIRFELIAGSGGGSFAGVMAADGTSISGEFSAPTPKGPMSAPVSLTRAGDAKIEAPPASTAIGGDLEGTWKASIEVNGNPVRVTMKLANRPDGTSAGTITTDGGGIDIPITTITQKGSALTVDVKIVGGTYAGSLSADKSELAGTWTQGAFEGPLTFKRAAAEGPK